MQAASILEVGPGRGDFLFELAKRHPDQIIAAVEIKRKRYEKLKPRLKRLGIENVVLVHGDARVALPVLIKEQQLEAGYILFSDPWPKDRHSKHRLFQPYFIHELARVIRPDGELVIAHDDESYLSEIRALCAEHPAFTAKTPLLTKEGSGEVNLFQTFYADKWREEGRKLHAAQHLLGVIDAADRDRIAVATGWQELWEYRDQVEIISESVT